MGLNEGTAAGWVESTEPIMGGRAAPAGDGFRKNSTSPTRLRQGSTSLMPRFAVRAQEACGSFLPQAVVVHPPTTSSEVEVRTLQREVTREFEHERIRAVECLHKSVAGAIARKCDLAGIVGILGCQTKVLDTIRIDVSVDARQVDCVFALPEVRNRVVLDVPVTLERVLRLVDAVVLEHVVFCSSRQRVAAKATDQCVLAAVSVQR